MDLKKLKELRRQKKIKQGELAKRIGVSRNLIRRIENGVGNPSYNTVKDFVEALGLELRAVN